MKRMPSSHLCPQCHNWFESSAVIARRFCTPVCQKAYAKANMEKAAFDRIESLGRHGLFDAVAGGFMKHNYGLSDGCV